MRGISLLGLPVLLFAATFAFAEDADALQDTAIAALKESQANPRAMSMRRASFPRPLKRMKPPEHRKDCRDELLSYTGAKRNEP